MQVSKIQQFQYYSQALKNNPAGLSYMNKNVLPQSPVEKNSSFELPPKEALTHANFPNISFKAGPMPDVVFLLNQTPWLKCAYSGRAMIHPEKAKNIYEKLLKKPNAQSAINYLQQYQKIMHDVESAIFDIFQDTPKKGKRDFQDILQEHRHDALERLKIKQTSVLHSTDRIIEKLEPSVAEQVLRARDFVLYTVEKGPFRRHTALDMIQSVRGKGDDNKRLKRIYKAWYKLPSSSTDVDAFIVKYSNSSHHSIAKRLIRSAVATIEHVKPHSRGGMSELGNYLLVSAGFNNNRHSMPLAEYIELNSHIDMRTNIQNYMDSVIAEVNNKKSEFAERSFYPLEIAESIRKETKGFFNPDTSALRLNKAQKREIEYPQKLGTKYRILAK